MKKILDLIIIAGNLFGFFTKFEKTFIFSLGLVSSLMLNHIGYMLSVLNLEELNPEEKLSPLSSGFIASMIWLLAIMVRAMDILDHEEKKYEKLIGTTEGLDPPNHKNSLKHISLGIGVLTGTLAYVYVAIHIINK